ncbi:hypothetical protein CLV30_12873 [Haloactinopolyspora alba]|uniref:Uncharacterized protein n=1 Tax=Haloactinopolyspora alba TaxID=648780 RepID=A0A2P8DF27_9ACTN|nr:hypothetical protein [Haloactinopolyspora alba]PSK95821.1 hypothetical protein CLV30_12873 [Haloactinopolyspora alba]
MTRAELLEALLCERYAPTRPERVARGEPAQPPHVDDSEITTARRRRELDEALDSHEDHRRPA